MNLSRKIIFFLCILSISLASAQKADKNCIRIGFWNVENFFDTKKDSLKDDKDFTPEGKYRWTQKKFDEKKNNISKAIVALGEGNPPAIVGLCEVENVRVLEELCKNTPLNKFKYRFIHFESLDVRGIDVALIYRQDLFKPIESYPISITFSKDPYKTRDIIFVKGIVFENDTIGIYVNHFPSKFRGAIAEKRRILVAEILRESIEKQLRNNPSLPLIIMGDFNDAPDSDPMKIIVPETNGNKEVLHNLMSGKMNAKGSYKYKTNWSFIDQIIVTKNLLSGNNLRIKNGKAFVFNPDFMQITDNKYIGTRPFRTFIGIKYIGGFSDHFPVYVDLEKVKDK